MGRIRCKAPQQRPKSLKRANRSRGQCGERGCGGSAGLLAQAEQRGAGRALSWGEAGSFPRPLVRRAAAEALATAWLMQGAEERPPGSQLHRGVSVGGQGCGSLGKESAETWTLPLTAFLKSVFEAVTLSTGHFYLDPLESQVWNAILDPPPRLCPLTRGGFTLAHALKNGPRFSSLKPS